MCETFKWIDHYMICFPGEKLRSVSLRIQLSPGRTFSFSHWDLYIPKGVNGIIWHLRPCKFSCSYWLARFEVRKTLSKRWHNSIKISSSGNGKACSTVNARCCIAVDFVCSQMKIKMNETKTDLSTYDWHADWLTDRRKERQVDRPTDWMKKWKL